MIKPMIYADSFYPKDPKILEEMFENFEKSEILDNFRYLIVPHAGYIYSGFTANIAYKSVDISNKKRVIIIGPSHKVYLDGISVSLFDEVETPCGNLKIDKDYANNIYNSYDFVTFLQNAHKEHSTETQFPFIKKYFKDIKVVEFVYGKLDYKILSLLIENLLEDDDNFIVISTDLSHFYNLAKANKLDNYCIKAIQNLDLSIWDQGCEACGRVGVKALIKVANNMKLNPTILDYRTSYDASGDKNRVVGYVSAVFN